MPRCRSFLTLTGGTTGPDGLPEVVVTMTTPTGETVGFAGKAVHIALEVHDPDARTPKNG